MRKSNRRKAGSGEASVQNSYLDNLRQRRRKIPFWRFGRVRSYVRPFRAVEKADRVESFHRETIVALAEVLAAAGLDHPAQLRPHHIWKRTAAGRVETFEQIYPFLKSGELLSGAQETWFKESWTNARSDSFSPA